MPVPNTTCQNVVNSFLKGGLEFTKLVKTEGQQNIVLKGGDRLKTVVGHLVDVQGEGGDAKGKKAPDTAQCRALLKDANDHFLGKLTGNTEKPRNKTMSSYSGDAIMLHDAWAMALKLAKQTARRSRKKAEVGECAGVERKQALEIQVNDVRLASQLAGASSSDMPAATQVQILGQLEAMEAVKSGIEDDASDAYSHSYSCYSQDSYSSHTDIGSEVENAEKDNKEILKLARAIPPVDDKFLLDVMTPSPKKPTGDSKR